MSIKSTLFQYKTYKLTRVIVPAKIEWNWEASGKAPAPLIVKARKATSQLRNTFSCCTSN
jgi:hypothetical protein